MRNISWDTVYDKLEQSPCACEKGVVIRHNCMRMDDWNQSEIYYYGEEIQCNDCGKKYHIEYYTRSYTCPSWVGDGIIETPYLIPNGMTLKHDISGKFFGFNLEEQIVSSFEEENIHMVIDDMETNKYSTRLKLADSNRIVDLYYQRYHKRSLPDIIELLHKCIYNYNTYEWTFDKMQEYKIEEQQRIKVNNQMINDTISQSYKLEFRSN